MQPRFHTAQSCNIGYTDMADGTSIAHATRLACGEACTVSGVRMKIIGIRASTYSTPEWAGAPDR